jgi:hypothetical protein
MPALRLHVPRHHPPPPPPQLMVDGPGFVADDHCDGPGAQQVETATKKAAQPGRRAALPRAQTNDQQRLYTCARAAAASATKRQKNQVPEGLAWAVRSETSFAV